MPELTVESVSCVVPDQKKGQSVAPFSAVMDVMSNTGSIAAEPVCWGERS